MSYMDAYRDWEGLDGCFPHDFVAVFAATSPELFHTLTGRVTVITDGDARGRTRLEPDASSHVEVAMGGELKRVRRFLDCLFDSEFRCAARNAV